MNELTEADFEVLVMTSAHDRQEGAYKLYKAYRAGVGNIAYNGEKIPEWPQIKWRAKWGWICAYDEASRMLVTRRPLAELD